MHICLSVFLGLSWEMFPAVMKLTFMFCHQSFSYQLYLSMYINSTVDVSSTSRQYHLAPAINDKFLLPRALFVFCLLQVSDNFIQSLFSKCPFQSNFTQVGFQKQGCVPCLVKTHFYVNKNERIWLGMLYSMERVSFIFLKFESKMLFSWIKQWIKSIPLQ